MDARSQLHALRQLDPSQLPPEEAQRLWGRLLDLCEQLLAEQGALRAALAGKGQHGRGPRGGGSPPGGPAGPGKWPDTAGKPPTGETPRANRDRKLPPVPGQTQGVRTILNFTWDADGRRTRVEQPGVRANQDS